MLHAAPEQVLIERARHGSEEPGPAVVGRGYRDGGGLAGGALAAAHDLALGDLEAQRAARRFEAEGGVPVAGGQAKLGIAVGGQREADGIGEVHAELYPVPAPTTGAPRPSSISGGSPSLTPLRAAC